MFFHEFGEDLVLALQLGLEAFNLLLLSGLGLLGVPAVAGKGSRAVLEKGLLPEVELTGLEAVLLTELGDGNLFEEVLPENGDLLLGREMPTAGVHEMFPRSWLSLTTNEGKSSSD